MWTTFQQHDLFEKEWANQSTKYNAVAILAPFITIKCGSGAIKNSNLGFDFVFESLCCMFFGVSFFFNPCFVKFELCFSCLARRASLLWHSKKSCILLVVAVSPANILTKIKNRTENTKNGVVRPCVNASRHAGVWRCRRAPWIGSYLSFYSTYDPHGMPHEGVDEWHPRRSTITAVHAFARAH